MPNIITHANQYTAGQSGGALTVAHY